MFVRLFERLSIVVGALLLIGVIVNGQSTRPRRTQPKQDSLLLPQPTPTPAPRSSNVPLLDVKPVKPVGEAPAVAAASADTTHAYQLFQQKQYAAAAKEAKQVAANEPQNAEAWKLAGFAEFQLKQYDDASGDLQKALDLQRTTKQEDANTIDLLGEAYFRIKKYDQALPLLVITTSRPGTQPDKDALYDRGFAEYETGKVTEAEKTFNAAVKLDPKDSRSLTYLGIIAMKRSDLDGGIAAFNRVTLSDPKNAFAWTQLTVAYLRRAGSATDEAKADADYLNAVRAGEGLIKVSTDGDAVTLFGQALIGAKQYARAATALEKATTAADAKENTFYLLGVAQSRAKNFPKAIVALEHAAQKKPDDVNVYRELGYAYEVSKQYAKALGAYQKGLKLIPEDADFKESVERVKPFAK